jgi:hypothetical protein
MHCTTEFDLSLPGDGIREGSLSYFTRDGACSKAALSCEKNSQTVVENIEIYPLNSLGVVRQSPKNGGRSVRKANIFQGWQTLIRHAQV